MDGVVSSSPLPAEPRRIRRGRLSPVPMIALIVSLLSAGSVPASPGDIDTFAGFVSDGEGLPATEAAVAWPISVAVDPSGGLAFASEFRIRQVTSSGTIRTLAGNGRDGFCGDGGPAVDACLSVSVLKTSGSGIAFDPVGNLYISDSANARVRRVDAASGIITTVAGGTDGYCGDGGRATDACLSYPLGIALGPSGDLFIADYLNFVVRRVDPSGIISTTAGSLHQGFCGDGGPAIDACLGPSGVSVGPSGDLYITDFMNNRIRKVDSSGTIRTVAGGDPQCATQFGGVVVGDGGPATAACVYQPVGGIVFDTAGNFFIPDSGNARIRKVSPTGIISTVAGNGRYGDCGDGGPAILACLYLPVGLAMSPAGELFFPDLWNHRVRKVDTSGIITSAAGTGSRRNVCRDGATALTACLFVPTDVAVDSSGRVYVADTNNHRVLRIDPSGNIRTIAGGGAACTRHPRENSAVPLQLVPLVPWVGLGDGGPATTACLDTPTYLALDQAGNLFIADSGNSRVRKVDSLGLITTVAGNGTAQSCGNGGPAITACVGVPTGLALDQAGNLYVADWFNDRIRKIDPFGIISTVAGGCYGYNGDGRPAISACLYGPGGLSIDNDGNLYIADSWNHRIRRVDPAGYITTLAGGANAGSPDQPGFVPYCGDGGAATSACLYYPWAVDVASQGDIFIADTGNSRIRKIDGSGTITTVAGNGTYGFCGDGGPATAACLSFPFGIALDVSGNLFIADSFNDRIRKVTGQSPLARLSADAPATGSAQGFGTFDSGLRRLCSRVGLMPSLSLTPWLQDAMKFRGESCQR